MDSTPTLPTLDRLKAKVPEIRSAAAVAQEWLTAFAQSNDNQETDTTASLFLNDSSWRDILALTSDIRSFAGWKKIRKLLESRRGHILSPRLSLNDLDDSPLLERPYPDLVFIRFSFSFATPIGPGLGIARLVPCEDSKWRAWAMFTYLDSLDKFLEEVGVNRSTATSPGPWEDLRKKQNDFSDGSPQVLVIGAGQAGLEVAARLKHLNVSTLVIERSERIGDNWRKRYDSLCLHDTVWYDHLPYMPFPSSWPVYCSAGKLANFLEAYAETLELRVWTSSEVQQTSWNSSTKTWSVIIRRGDEIRDMTVQHLVFATGALGGLANIPDIANRDIFKGEVCHSSNFKTARKFVGKKALVVGTGNSGHDIAQDFSRHGVDVTMYQRSETFVISAKAVAKILDTFRYNEGANLEQADRLNASLTFEVVKLFHQRIMANVAQTMDRDILDGLKTVGFMTTRGPDDAGIFPLLLMRHGGYYMDTGASQEIIDGKIKLKAGSEIKRFFEKGIEFEDGTVLEADVIVFATGYGNPKAVVEDVCGLDVSKQLLPIWGVNDEGELNSVWKSSGHEGLWIAMGNLSICRFWSKVLAIQIKTTIEGILPPKFEDST